MTVVRRRAMMSVVAVWGSCATAAMAGTMFAAEPSDYRQGSYRASTPPTLHGARVLTTQEAHALWQSGGAAFVDVLPQAPRPAGLPAGTIWRDRPRFDVPGSLWLPDTGYGALAPAMQDYFVRGLRAAQGSQRDRLLVLYCQADCWMSWNAAKRALALGFAPVAWYRDGTTGWQAQGFPLQLCMPEPRPRSARADPG